jgi:hypothetical protein
MRTLLAVLCMIATGPSTPRPGHAAAAAPLIISVTEYGARPDSLRNATGAINSAIAEAARNSHRPVVLRFPTGRYDLFWTTAPRAVYHVSNTTTQAVAPVKTIGLWLKDIRNVTVDGQGSLLVFHGKMTPIVIDHCDNVTVMNLRVDFQRPTVSEIQVTAVGESDLQVKVHDDSSYRLENGKLIWVGEGWTSDGVLSVEYDPSSDSSRRTAWNPIRDALDVQEIHHNLLRLTYAAKPPTVTGHVFQLRDHTRDQIGALILRSRNVTWRNVAMHFTHGIGIVGQYSSNLTFDRLICEPRSGTGRTASSFADSMQFSGCAGRIRITNSRFAGSQDDHINVHGTYLRIVGRPSPNRLLVRFMQPESWGFEAFFPGDEIDLVQGATLIPFAKARVTAAETVNPTDVLITLKKPVTADIGTEDYVENVTWTPEVLIRGCRFARVPTRGILITTRRKVVVERNLFWRPAMSAILIANDARSWYESGSVRDVTVADNTFVGGGDPVILIRPEVREPNHNPPVHRNIAIERNRFELTGNRLLDASNTEGLSLTKNRIVVIRPATIESLSSFVACTNVQIDGNRIHLVPATRGRAIRRRGQIAPHVTRVAHSRPYSRASGTHKTTHKS